MDKTIARSLDRRESPDFASFTATEVIFRAAIADPSGAGHRLLLRLGVDPTNFGRQTGES